MASTINADNGVVSGSSGVKTTADTSGVLALQSNGSTGITLGTDLVTTLANPLPVGSGGTGATSLSGITAGTATNLAGGSNGTIPYQSASGTTQMLAAGTSGQVLTSNGAAAPTWATPAPGAGTVTAVASGALSDGSAVILNSDGTVSVVAASAGSASTAIPLTSADSSRTVASNAPSAVASFDPSTNTVVVFYCAANTSSYLYATAGTVSNGVITFGTGKLEVFGAGINGALTWGFGAVFVPSVNRHVVFFERNSSDVVSRMVYTSGSGTSTSVTLVSGGSQTIMSGDLIGPKCVYDPVSDKVVVVACWPGNSNAVQACTVTVTATTITANATTTIMSGGYGHSPAICLDPTDNKILVLGQGSSSYPRVAVGTISGTSISFGTPVVVQSAAAAFYNCYAIAYSVADSKVFVAYGLESISQPRGAVGTVSGTSISFGTPQAFGYGTTSNLPFSAVYYATTGKVYFLQSYTQLRIDFSGTTFSTANEYSYSSISYATLIYLSGLDMMLATGPGYYSGVYNPSVMASSAYSTNLTSNNFLGFSSAAYTNGQTATISTVGSTITNQSGLTTATKYYVGPGGGLNTNSSQPYAGLAMSATKLVVKG